MQESKGGELGGGPGMGESLEGIDAPTLRRCINYRIFAPGSRLSNQEWLMGVSLVAQWIRIRRQCRGHGFEP